MSTGSRDCRDEIHVKTIPRSKGAKLVFSIARWGDPERMVLRVQTYAPTAFAGWCAGGPALVIQGEDFDELIEALVRGRDALSACASYLQEKGVPRTAVSLTAVEPRERAH